MQHMSIGVYKHFRTSCQSHPCRWD